LGLESLLEGRLDGLLLDKSGLLGGVISNSLAIELGLLGSVVSGLSIELGLLGGVIGSLSVELSLLGGIVSSLTVELGLLGGIDSLTIELSLLGFVDGLTIELLGETTRLEVLVLGSGVGIIARVLESGLIGGGVLSKLDGLSGVVSLTIELSFLGFVDGLTIKLGGFSSGVNSFSILVLNSDGFNRGAQK
jgi:hypothetical protein